MIGGIWALAPLCERLGPAKVYALAAGVMIGGVLQLAVQIPALARAGCLPRIRLGRAALGEAWRHPGVRQVMRQMAPALLGVSVAQISVLINTQIASHQGVGAVSWLDYASRLMEFPTAMLGVAVGAVLIPQLSAARAREDSAAYSGMLDWGLRLTLMLALPCSVALLVFPEPLVATLFQRGQFDALARSTRPRLPCAATACGLHRPDRRQDPGARLLCPPGPAHAGEDRRRRAHPHAGDEPGVRAAVRPRRPGPVRSASGAHQCPAWLFVGPAPRRLVQARARAGAGSRSRSASPRCSWAACSGRRRRGSTGSAWPAGSGCGSAGSRACLGAAAALYFATLGLAGLRPRDFSRRG